MSNYLICSIGKLVILYIHDAAIIRRMHVFKLVLMHIDDPRTIWTNLFFKVEGSEVIVISHKKMVALLRMT